MKCPKCNTDNPPSAAVCSSCGSPLSDAPYTTIDNGTDGKARRKKWPLILILVLLLLTCGGFLGYNYYINRVEKECITFTNELFRGLKELDLSNIEEKYHPKEMPVDPDLKGVIENRIKEVLKNSALASVVDIDSLDINYDLIFDELTEDARYKIVSTDTKWNECTVRVTTSNADFEKLPKMLLEKAKEEVDNLSKPDTIAGILSNLISEHLPGQNNEDNSQSEDDDENTEDRSSGNIVTDAVSNFTQLFLEWFREVKDEAPKKTATADIVFKFKDGKWTIDSFDKELIYSFYGVPSDILE